ncbi:hypothetical protein [Pseudonocardia sp. ICBG1142]|uniref:hypothetical protein n=1 Tax=Pseudonocardia sp. ICBG1142 TaxID=2846760 RepID=UPI001CF6F477|nr:hypothetical protein [Pseudonocardia sp. ICBG1142]
MSHHDDQTGRDEAGGASPAHHASSGDKLAQVITLHQHTGTRDAEAPVVVEGEIVACGAQVEGPAPGTPGTGVVSRRDLYRSDLHAAGRGALAAATHPATVTTTKALVRNTFYVFLRRRGPRSAVAGHPRHQPV